MIVWLLVFVVMLLVVAGMAVGVMAGRKPIAGSCGGIANLGIEKSCGICGNDFTKCTSNQPADEAGSQDRSAATNNAAPADNLVRQESL